MRIQLTSFDHKNDPLISSSDIPDRLQKCLLPNSENRFHFTKYFEYLEQWYESNNCMMCWLDIEAFDDCTGFSVADQPMVAIVYMLERTISIFMNGTENVTISHGYSYLFYIPLERGHEISFKKGHYRMMYCTFPDDCLKHLAKDYMEIAGLLEKYQMASPLGIIEKPTAIESNALYQMWLAQQCKEGTVFCQAYLGARCVDLVLDYVLRSQTGSNERKIFSGEMIAKKEKVFGVKKMIDEYDHGKMEIKNIAHTVGLNQGQLKKIFKECFGITIGQYQLQARMLRARRLLLETDDTIMDIALSVGYQDDSSLSRMFKKKNGIHPRGFRIMHKK